jgi:hypothetical protein
VLNKLPSYSVKPCKSQVKATGAAVGKPASIQFEVSNCNVDSLRLHWGALQPGKR